MHIEIALHRFTAFACGALALLGLVGAARAETSPWYVAASQSYTYDSNLLRLGSGQATPDGYSRNDDVLSTALLAGLDQPIGRQRLFGNLTVRQNRYSGNPRFNNTSYNATLGLDWSTIERVSGSVSASANRALQSFSTDLFSTERLNNQESSETLNGNIAVGVVTEYSLVASGGHRRVTNSLPDPGIRSRDFYQDNAEVGLRWAPTSTASFGLALGTTRGRYPKFTTAGTGEYQADRFKRNDVVLTATLKPSGASTVDIRLANGRTRYDLNQQRDFSGLTGSVVWGWQATGKLRVSTQLSRDTGQDSYLTRTIQTNQPTTADYSRLTNQLRVQVNHDLTAKFGLTAGASYASRDLVRTINDPLIAADATDSDRSTLLSAGVRWAPRRYGTLGCDVTMEKRKASSEPVLTSDMSAKSLTCFGQLTLQ
jgi:hypothetical protein